MDSLINQVLVETGKSVHYFLNGGGCYQFAKLLNAKIDGQIIYLIDEYHFVVGYSGRLYDARGNVTKLYSSSKKLTEEEFLKREKLRNQYKGGDLI